MGHREIIAKLGTRPKGGSPKDNFELRIADLGFRRAEDRGRRSEVRGQERFIRELEN